MFRALNEGKIKAEESDDVDPEDDLDAAADIAEVLDGDFSSDFISIKYSKVPAKGPEMEEGEEEEEDEEIESVPYRRFGKRRITMTAAAAKRMKREQATKQVPNASYDFS